MSRISKDNDDASSTLSDSLGHISAPITLFDRMGGEPKMKELTHKFFNLMIRQKELDRFYANVPYATMQLHREKLMKVLFGVEEERPTSDEILDYIMTTHARLFRDLGLNADHFDIFLKCMVDVLNEMKYPQSVIDECVLIFRPMRTAFSYGAQVAKDEKKLEEENKKDLPVASTVTMRTNAQAVLAAGYPPPPQWLVNSLGGRENVRAWTCALTLRFTVDDPVLSETFMALPYWDVEPYLHGLLQVAFAEEFGDRRSGRLLMRTLRFPLGLSLAEYQLTQTLFTRMVTHFETAGATLLKDDPEKLKAAVERLLACRRWFIETDPCGVRKVGTETEHALKKDATDRSIGDSSIDSYDTEIRDMLPSDASKTDSLDPKWVRALKNVQKPVNAIFNQAGKPVSAIFVWLKGREADAQRDATAAH